MRLKGFAVIRQTTCKRRLLWKPELRSRPRYSSRPARRSRLIRAPGSTWSGREVLPARGNTLAPPRRRELKNVKTGKRELSRRGGEPKLGLPIAPYLGISYSPSSLGRKPNFLARAREAFRDFTPAVQVASASEAAAMQTPVNRQRLSPQPSCRPSKTPAQNASPAPAIPPM